MRELVEFLARSVVHRPGEVRVREIEGGRTVRIEISEPPGEVGKVIGRQGRVIRAIRVLAGAAASLQGKRVRVSVVEQEGS